jgi:pilus assembly protein Flp/PilA
MPEWMSAVIALAGPLAVVGVGVYAFTTRRARGVARHARGSELDVEQRYADGVRSPWHPRPWTGHVDDRGASAVEYGLMVAAIAVVIMAVVFGLGGALASAFSVTSSHLEHCTGTVPSPCPDSTGSGGAGDPPAAP